MVEQHPQHELVAADITRIYRDDLGVDVCALEHFTITVKNGEIVSLVGPSGCGKSTFLRLVAGLDLPQQGVLLYDGQEITQPHYERGFVFQEANLFPWLTVYDNIAFGLKARGILNQNKSKIDDYIKLMGLDGFEKSYPHQISGGMASRASLARTFIQDPGLILLDEPLSALDAFTRVKLQQEILHIWQRNKPNIILVTHDIEEAVYLSHRIVVMSRRPGRVLAEIAVDLPHPRDRMSEKFIGSRRQVLNALQDI